tara:strand:+ start:148 stop:1023 length:876 start_codon:yes stop_codon:yes gene_type:complete
MSFIQSINNNPEKITLYKYKGDDLNITLNEKKLSFEELQNSITISFIDLETTGFDKLSAEIIEIAIKTIVLDMVNGKILKVIHSYESFQEPKKTIDRIITQVTGITDNMVEGCTIDWTKVNDIFSDSDLIIAHNARFDRGFTDLLLPISKNKIWACSQNDINWLERGFSSPKLELLCTWHGFYYDSHRAMNDVKALIHLTTHSYYKNNQKPILELLKNSKNPVYKIIVNNCPFNLKHIVKSNYYRWNGKEWWKKIQESEIETEKRFLAKHIYNGQFLGTIKEIAIYDKYKE